jgi:hypothetical protein
LEIFALLFFGKNYDIQKGEEINILGFEEYFLKERKVVNQFKKYLDVPPLGKEANSLLCSFGPFP